MDRLYRWWLFVQDRVVGYAAALTMLAVTGLAVLEIVRRYLLGKTYYWGQDAVVFFLVAASFLYFGVTQARRAHLALTAVQEWLGNKGYIRAVLLIKATATTLSLLFIAGFIYWGVPSVERTRELGRTTQSLFFVIWPFQYALIAGFATMGITMLFQLYKDLQALRGKEVFPWDKSDEGFEV